MSIEVTRGLVGASDLALGEGQFTRKGASGATETLDKINALHILLSAAVAALSPAQATTVDRAIQEFYQYIISPPPQTLPPNSLGVVLTATWEWAYVGSDWAMRNISLIASTPILELQGSDPSTQTGEYKMYMKTYGANDEMYIRDPNSGSVMRMASADYVDTEAVNRVRMALLLGL